MKIDVHEAVVTAEELLERLRELDGAEPDDAPTRAARRERSEITRTLLYLQHLANRTSVQVMDAYHAFKIRDDPPEG